MPSSGSRSSGRTMKRSRRGSTTWAVLWPYAIATRAPRSEEHTSELQSHSDLVCRLLLEKKKAADERADLLVACTRVAEPLRVGGHLAVLLLYFFFNVTATTEIYTLSLHDALPIPVVESGAADAFGFTPAEPALCCASH